MTAKFLPCDCAGTAPGFPQHESGCSSSTPAEREEFAPSTAYGDGGDPWADAVIDEAPPFE